MAHEIERKFLVVGDYKSEAYASVRITHGYLSRVPERVVRIRIKGDKGFITIKNTDGKHTWEVDEFHGDNEGLIMAEIELESESDLFDKPSWLGKEVTGDKRYYNAYLSEKPFKNW